VPTRNGELFRWCLNHGLRLVHQTIASASFTTQAADFACLVGHPSLRVLIAYPGGKKVNGEIKRMFPGVAR
jgi:hypothetical protein